MTQASIKSFKCAVLFKMYEVKVFLGKKKLAKFANDCRLATDNKVRISLDTQMSLLNDSWQRQKCQRSIDV